MGDPDDEVAGSAQRGVIRAVVDLRWCSTSDGSGRALPVGRTNPEGAVAVAGSPPPPGCGGRYHAAVPRCPECHRRLRGGAVCPRDGRVAALERAPEAGPAPALPGFRVTGLLGAGGSGAVWAAIAPNGSTAAFKVARAPGPHWRAGFAREAQAMAAVGAPHAPALLGQGALADGRAWIGMELLRGETVADALAGIDRPDPARGHALADAVLSAAEAVHGAGLVHRDLKPENLLVRAGAASIAITDFGLAERREKIERAAVSGFALGTLGYMAPEVMAGRAGGMRADVYALGVVLYEIFTLRAPFGGDAQALEHAHMALRPPPPSLFAGVSLAVDELLLACLAKEPDRRPADAGEVRRMLQAAGGGASGGRAKRSEDRPGSGAADGAAEDAIEGPIEDAAEGAIHGTAAGELDRATDRAEERGELVALAWLDAEAGPARLAADLARTPGILARQHGRICVAVFAAARADRPAAAALSAAGRLLGTWGGRAALHVARVELTRRDGRAPAVHGAAVDRPESWLPVMPWGGLLLSRAFIDALGDLAVVPAGPAGFFAPAGSLASAAPPLVGRAAVMDALEASARHCFAGGRPGLVALVGGPGSGKSRLVGEAEAAATRLGGSALRIDAADRRALDPVDGEGLRERARRGPLAVLVDDAHLADDAVLDALEYATLDGAGLPLWVLVAADARAIDQIRPRFGQRAEKSERIELEPLADGAMRELAASLLVPADYLPAAVLDRLAVLAGGNPGRLSELVRALKREGAVRPRSDRRSHQVAVDAIERVPATAAGRWEASRALDALPPELAASARVAAAIGPIIDEAELDWVEDALERRDGEGSFFDARVALRALCSRDLVVERGAGSGSWVFASPLVQDAICQAMPAAERVRIHQHALGYWRGRGGGRALAAVARHAGLAGAHGEAVAAALELAAGAAAAHRELEAERWYSAALLHIADQPIRMRALLGRGRVRWRLDRGPEALADLAAARALAGQLGADIELAGALLDEAMVLDWCGDLEASAARVEEARALIDAGGAGPLPARLLVASGRTLWRQGHVGEAIDQLSDGAARAVDLETRLIALLLLGCAHCWGGRLAEADASFAEAEDLARAADDRLHLCALHVNRLFLWLAREDSARGADDLRRAVKLAREIGHPIVERGATHNLAELLHYEGRDAEALPLALRSFELQHRFVARPGPEDAVLLCRVALALGDGDSAGRHLAWIEAHAPIAGAAPPLRVFHRAVELVQRGETGEAWDRVIADAAGMLPIEHLELLALRATAEIFGGQIDAAESTIAAARTYTDRFPIWRQRLEAIRAGTRAGGNMQQALFDAAQKHSIPSS